MARRGNGAGYGGPAKGPGWGGPARGIGDNSGTAAPFEPGNRAAAGRHSFHRAERREVLLEELFDLAMHAADENLQISAATAYLNRVEGPPTPMRRDAVGEQDADDGH